MDDADALVRKVDEWVALQKKCSRKLNNLPDELEKAVKAANVTKVVGRSVLVGGAAAMMAVGVAAGVLTFLSGGAALPVLAAVGVAGAMASQAGALTSVGSDVYSGSKSKDIMEKAQKVLEELQSLEQEIKDLMESLKRQASSFCDDGGGGDDDDGNVMEFFMRSMARQEGLELHSSIVISDVFGLQHINIFRRIKANSIVLAACLTVLKGALVAVAKQGGKKVASSLGKKAASAAGESVAGGAAGLKLSVPELVTDCQNLDNIETEARKTLRKNARTVLTSAEETEKELQNLRKALKKLVRIKFIIEKGKRTRDEKKELIDYAITNSPYPEVQQWLRENAESEVFFSLVNLGNFITQKLKEEAKKKKKEDRKRKKIELVFLAHGCIVNSMIPARCLLPLPSITDVLLYSPWNCKLSARAAYSIATGGIQPHHRLFKCTKSSKCPLPPAAHTPFNLPPNWNSMRNTGLQPVPIIMVRPVAKEEDRAFAAFINLEARFGAPAANRYLIPYLPLWIGDVPFFSVTLAISLVLLFSFSEYEATVHLAACLGKFPPDTVMQEEYLRRQYAYTVDNTIMTVQRETIGYIDDPVFNMFRAVFGDESPFL